MALAVVRCSLAVCRAPFCMDNICRCGGSKLARKSADDLWRVFLAVLSVQRQTRCATAAYAAASARCAILEPRKVYLLTMKKVICITRKHVSALQLHIYWPLIRYILAPKNIYIATQLHIYWHTRNAGRRFFDLAWLWNENSVCNTFLPKIQYLHPPVGCGLHYAWLSYDTTC